MRKLATDTSKCPFLPYVFLPRILYPQTKGHLHNGRLCPALPSTEESCLKTSNNFIYLNLRLVLLSCIFLYSPDLCLVQYVTSHFFSDSFTYFLSTNYKNLLSGDLEYTFFFCIFCKIQSKYINFEL